MKSKSFTLIVLTLLIAAASCGKANLQTTYNNQESKIDKFISSLDESYRKKNLDPDGNPTDSLDIFHNKGSHRVVITRGLQGDDAQELSETGTVCIYYAGYIFNGSAPAVSSLFTTNKEEIATDAKWDSSDESLFEPLTVDMAKDDLLEGLMNGLVGVRQGEECYILFSGLHAFGNKKFGTVPANSALLFDVWVESLSND